MLLSFSEFVRALLVSQPANCLAQIFNIFIFIQPQHSKVLWIQKQKMAEMSLGKGRYCEDWGMVKDALSGTKMPVTLPIVVFSSHVNYKNSALIFLHNSVNKSILSYNEIYNY